MKLYIMRHGEAHYPKGSYSDRERRLTPEGEREVLTTTRWLVERHREVDCVFVSPYLRAQQTATVLFSELKTKHRENCDAITPDGHAAAVASWLAAEIETHGYETVVLVSHMPLVSYLVHELDASVQPPIFPTAGIAVIEFSPETLTGKFQQLMIAEKCAG
jgi:phosphohistidine phosphatase